MSGIVEMLREYLTITESGREETDELEELASKLSLSDTPQQVRGRGSLPSIGRKPRLGGFVVYTSMSTLIQDGQQIHRACIVEHEAPLIIAKNQPPKKVFPSIKHWEMSTFLSPKENKMAGPNFSPRGSTVDLKKTS